MKHGRNITVTIDPCELCVNENLRTNRIADVTSRERDRVLIVTVSECAGRNVTVS
jgi:hypothetical protein